jgi:hypothetical protein
MSRRPRRREVRPFFEALELRQLLHVDAELARLSAPLPIHAVPLRDALESRPPDIGPHRAASFSVVASALPAGHHSFTGLIAADNAAGGTHYSATGLTAHHRSAHTAIPSVYDGTNPLAKRMATGVAAHAMPLGADAIHASLAHAPSALGAADGSAQVLGVFVPERSVTSLLAAGHAGSAIESSPTGHVIHADARGRVFDSTLGLHYYRLRYHHAARAGHDLGHHHATADGHAQHHASPPRGKGASGTASTLSTVSPKLPLSAQDTGDSDQVITSPYVAFPFSMPEGQTISGTLFYFYESDQNDPNDITDGGGNFTATITWGDGTSSAGGIVGVGTNGGLGVTGSHQYTEEGTYTIGVTITDVDNAGGGASFGITVNDANLTSSGVSFGTIEGQTISGVVANFTDSFAAAPSSDYSATINWGDGTSSPGTIAGHAVDGSHSYADEGTYAISTQINDDGGALTSAISPVTVSDAPFVAYGSGIGEDVDDAGQTLSGYWAFFSEGPGEGSEFSATINWGDGTTGQGAITE